MVHNDRDGAHFGAEQGARRERWIYIVTDEGRRTAPKGARPLWGSPGELHRSSSGGLFGDTTPPCAALLAGTPLRAITAVADHRS